MKMITDYEVEGCWASPKSKPTCRLCGTIFQPNPKEGHFNSKYWKLARNDGTFLKCCPNGCNVKEAEKKQEEFSKIQYYCVAKSESWEYKLDYTKINNAWIDRQGKVYPLEYMGHVKFAYDEQDSDERTLEETGWLKLASKEFYWEKKLSQSQIDMIFDYLIVVGVKKDIKNFEEVLDWDCALLKLEKHG